MTVQNNFFAVLNTSADPDSDITFNLPTIPIPDSPPKLAKRKIRKASPRTKEQTISPSISSSDLDLKIINDFERPQSPEMATPILNNLMQKNQRKILEPVPKSTRKIIILGDSLEDNFYFLEPNNVLTDSNSLLHNPSNSDPNFIVTIPNKLNLPNPNSMLINPNPNSVHNSTVVNSVHNSTVVNSNKLNSIVVTDLTKITKPTNRLIPYPRFPNSNMPTDIQKNKQKSFLDVDTCSQQNIISEDIKWNFPPLKTNDNMEIDSSFVSTPTPFTDPNTQKPKGSPVKKYNQFTPRIDFFNAPNTPKNPEKITFIKFSDKAEIYSQNRAGIIPYNITSDNKIEICMGVDSKHGDVTDHGGRVKYNESPIDAALREFHEETLDVFQPLDQNDERIKNSFLLYSASTLIMFVRMNTNFEQKKEQFHNILPTKKFSESNDLYITNLDLLINEISNPLKSKIKVYELVSNLILSAFQNYGDLGFYLLSG
jgi:hypothetical protein